MLFPDYTNRWHPNLTAWEWSTGSSSTSCFPSSCTVPALLILLRSLSWYGLWSCDSATAFPSLSHNTPRESPTLATVSSLSDSSAIRHVVPAGGEGGGWQRKRKQSEETFRRSPTSVCNNLESDLWGLLHSCVLNIQIWLRLSPKNKSTMKTNRPNRTKEEMLFSGAGCIKCHQRIDLDRGSEFHSSAESIHHTVLYCSVQQRNVTAQQSHSEAFVLTGDCAGNCEIFIWQQRAGHRKLPVLSYRLKLVWKHVWQPCRTIACRLQPCSLDFRMHFHFTSPKNTHLASSKSDFIPIIPLLGQKLSNHTHTQRHIQVYIRFPPPSSPSWPASSWLAESLSSISRSTVRMRCSRMLAYEWALSLFSRSKACSCCLRVSGRWAFT